MKATTLSKRRILVLLLGLTLVHGSAPMVRAACNPPPGEEAIVTSVTVKDVASGRTHTVVVGSTSPDTQNGSTFYICGPESGTVAMEMSASGTRLTNVGWRVEESSSMGAGCNTASGTLAGGASPQEGPVQTPSAGCPGRDSQSTLTVTPSSRTFYLKPFCDMEPNCSKAGSESYFCDGAHNIEIKVVVLTIDLDIYRLDGTTKVDESKDDTEGSITRVLNPNDGETKGTGKTRGISLKLESSVLPTGLSLSYKLRLKYIHSVANDKGLVRVYEDTVSGSACIIDNCLSTPDMVEVLATSALSDGFWMEFEGGGIVELELVVLDGSTEVCKDSVRACAIPFKPKTGGILFVNPGARAGSLKNNYTDDSANTISAALAAAVDGMNVVVSSATYPESSLQIGRAISLGGLGLRWLANTSANFKDKTGVEYVPDYGVLPVIDGQLASWICQLQQDDTDISGLQLVNGKNTESGLGNGGGAIRSIDDVDDVDLCCNRFDANESHNSDGGAVLCHKGEGWAITDCLFTLNQSKTHGGAVVYYDTFGGESKIVRSIFAANKAERPASGTADTVQGGAVFLDRSDPTFQVSQCVFDGNQARDLCSGSDNGYSDSSYPSGDGLISVTEEDIGAWGGAICIYEDNPSVTITKTVFHGNQAYSENRRARGGAMLLRRVEDVFGDDAAATVSASYFLDNEVYGLRRGSGGAIDLFDGSCSADNCQFTGNKASSAPVFGLPGAGAGGSAGGIRGVVGGVWYTLNWRPLYMNYGGAVAVHHADISSASVFKASTGCVFDGNSAEYGCGGAICLVGSSEAATGEATALGDFGMQHVEIDGCTFKNNTTELHGGAIAGASRYSYLYIHNNSVLDHNHVVDTPLRPGQPGDVDGDGGAVSFQVAGPWVDPGLLTFVGAVFLGTSSGPPSPLYGGMVAEDTIFKFNTAKDGGGAVKHGGLSAASYENCSFEDNAAGTIAVYEGDGGAMRSSTVGATFFNETKFRRNTARGWGGAISLETSYAKASGSTTEFDQNTADCGGAISTQLRKSQFGTAVDLWVTLVAPFHYIGVDVLGNSWTDEVLFHANSAVGRNSVPGRGGAVYAVANLNEEGKNPPTLSELSCSLKYCRLTDNMAGSVGVNLSVDRQYACILAENRTDKPIDLTLKHSKVLNHVGIGVAMECFTNATDRIVGNIDDVIFQQNHVGVCSAHSDMDIDASTFVKQGAAGASVATYDVAIVGITHTGTGNPMKDVSQKVRINNTHFEADSPPMAAIMVGDVPGDAVNVDIEADDCCFMQRTAVPAPPPFAPPYGVWIQTGGAFGPLPLNNVDAKGCFWDQPVGSAASPHGPPVIINPGASVINPPAKIDWTGFLDTPLGACP